MTAYFWKKIFKTFLKTRFFEVKFIADSKSNGKKWVSRACFRDNQHLMEAYEGVFEVRSENNKNKYASNNSVMQAK